MPFPDYTRYKITVINGPEIALEERQEIIISELSDMPFESFETVNEFLLAYIPSEQDKIDFETSIKAFEGVSKIEKINIKGENWNKIWEESFDPIIVEEKIIVKAPFHVVEKEYKFEIIIEPKMSFGTGHHSTTRLMMESMLNLCFENKSVLDMGCGTGILAILAAKLGAAKIVAVDNDSQCIENCIENLDLNDCPNIQVFLNNEIYTNFKVDVILANIQKNVLIEQMSLYKSWLNDGGTLLVSGIYEIAVNDVIESAKMNELKYKTYHTLNKWCMIHFDLSEAKA